MITESKLALAESGIEDIAIALGVTEKYVVEILKQGMETLSPIGGKLSNTQQYFIDEMEANFN